MKNAKKFTVTITSALLAVAALTSTAEAACGFSNPTESSSFAAGDTMSITWTDIDNEGPKCADLSLTIELRVGSRDVQTPVAVVGDGIDGSAGGTSYEIPTQLPKTDDTYFLEMHDSAKGFQNFSARFAISGVESGGDDPSDPGKNGTGTDPDPKAGKDGEGGDNPDGKGKSGDDTPNGKDASDDANNTTETDNQTDKTDSSPTKGQNGNSGTGNQPNGSSNAGGAPTNSPDNNTTSPTDNTQPAAASSWFVSFASLAIVTVTVSLSNMF